MKVLLQKALEWRLAFTYGLLFSINSLCTAIIASFMNTEWRDLSDTSQFLLVVTVLANWTGTMLAFLSQIISKTQDKVREKTGMTDFFPKPGQGAGPKP